MDAQGQFLSLQSASDEWLVVNYWATWCEPCRDEIPELNSLASQDNGVRVWGVDFDNASSLEQLEGKINALNIAFPVVAPGDVPRLALEPPMVLPASYILDENGTLKKQLFGPQTRAGLERLISQLRQANRTETKQ